VGVLILGLVLFLGVHSVGPVAHEWRSRMVARRGPGPWKGVYSLISLLGLVLIVWGFSLARTHPVPLYAPSAALRHLNALFNLVAFVLLAAAYVPHNHFKAALGHPMLAGVALWALGHLLAIGMPRDAVLFGAFLLWSSLDFAVSRARDARQAVIYPRGALAGDALTMAIGVGAWAAVAFWLHTRLIGVSPFA
jgi:uncharacterized membrane protein